MGYGSAFAAPEAKLGGVIAGGVIKGVAREVGQLHHIATDKAIKSGFTKEFEIIFNKAGMSLNDPANKVFLEGHAGRHSPVYHQYVLDRLNSATNGLSSGNYDKALRLELDSLRQELLRNPNMVKGIGINK